MLAIGLGFLMYGFYLWLLANYTLEAAAMLTGLVAVLIAMISAISAVMFLRYRSRRIRETKAEIVETVNLALDIAHEEFALPVKENPKTALVIASFAGFIAGEKFL
jgi:uncharacterized membrane protein